MLTLRRLHPAQDFLDEITDDAQLAVLLTFAGTRSQSAAGTADTYVRLTVFLARGVFLVGIGSRLPARVAPALGLIGVAGVLLVVSVVQLLSLPARRHVTRPVPARRPRTPSAGLRTDIDEEGHSNECRSDHASQL